MLEVHVLLVRTIPLNIVPSICMSGSFLNEVCFKLLDTKLNKFNIQFTMHLILNYVKRIRLTRTLCRCTDLTVDCIRDPDMDCLCIA